MTRVVLSVLDAPLTRTLLDPAAWPFPVDARTAPSVDANSRAMLRGEFDVAEMSFATYLRARADGAPLRALPAFTGRRFLADHAGVRPTASVRSPADLAGARVAVPQYWMTSSVWHRILLRERHGVDPAAITWVTTAPERFELEPDGVRVERVDDGRDPATVVLDGDADVLLSPRPVPDGFLPLFGAGEAAEQYRATGVFPLMHLVVVCEALPAGVIAAAWEALLAARQAVWPGPAVPGLSTADTAALFRGDPFAYGVIPNAASLDALFAGAHRDGLLPAVPAPDDLFVELNREVVLP